MWQIRFTHAGREVAMSLPGMGGESGAIVTQLERLYPGLTGLEMWRERWTVPTAKCP
jgi:hypothetical protein